MKKQLFIMLIAVFIFGGLVGSAEAAIITNGFTYAVASGSDQSVGNHYHSNTGGSFGNPAGLAEVGNFSNEEVRGLSEYNLTGLSAASSAYVTFNTYGTGLFSGVNDFPFNGGIDIYAYQGNNAEDIADYQAPVVASVASFSTVGLNTGDIYSFDITGIFNTAIGSGWDSLGIRLQRQNPPINDGAWVFNDFRLTSTNDSTNPTNAVPEPATMVLMGVGLSGMALRKKFS